LIARNPDLMRLFTREAPAESGVQSSPVMDDELDVEVELES
jgi:hypothetical protein